MGEWRKSTRSASNGCVEVTPLPEGWVAIRDSKNPHGPELQFNPTEWQAFLDGAVSGEFDPEMLAAVQEQP